MNDEAKHTIVDKFGNWYKELPDKKKYAEFVTAFLSIPVLLTVIISNVNGLKARQAQPVPVEPTKIVQYVPVNSGTNNSQKEKEAPTPDLSVSISPSTSECKKEVGPVDISYPAEGTIVTENPVTVIVSYHPGEYCAAVWSYRINGGSWSAFDDKSFALYGMANGEKKIDLRVKSIASGEEVYLTRNFTYLSSEAGDTPTPQATESAMLVE